MAENGTSNTLVYNSEILKPDNMRFIFRELKQLTLKGFSESDLMSLTSLETAISGQIQTLNHPRMWHSILSTYSPINVTAAAELSGIFRPVIDDVTEIAVKGIIWGNKQLDEQDFKDSIQKQATFASVSVPQIDLPAQTLQEVVERTEYVLGTPFHSGSLEDALQVFLGDAVTSEHRALMDVMRVYGKGFSLQFPD